ncbi:MAG TPA: TetR/AcrR family transcriptional regulator [Thermoanaerobaculia bacterium]|nr:TetR/AcrR family transcriptional regulator [Thermoanaerobaculia bacterium]
MRVTAETKEATRLAILHTTRKLLLQEGWQNLSTREIASEAGIANGTLFNYFPTKEAIVGTLVADALADVNATPTTGSVEEQLFALIASGLRRLRPLRSFLAFVVDSILAHDSERIRSEHMAAVERILGQSLTPMLRHLYWSLYAGVITFWIADTSRKHEDTLAFVDHSVALFADALRRKESGA